MTELKRSISKFKKAKSSDVPTELAFLKSWCDNIMNPIKIAVGDSGNMANHGLKANRQLEKLDLIQNLAKNNKQICNSLVENDQLLQLCNYFEMIIKAGRHQKFYQLFSFLNDSDIIELLNEVFK